MDARRFLNFPKTHSLQARRKEIEEEKRGEDESSETSARKDRASGIKERQKGRARREASVKEREKGEGKKKRRCASRGSRATYGALAGSLAYYATELVSLSILSLSLSSPLSFSSFFGSITFLPDSESFVPSMRLFTLNSLAVSQIPPCLHNGESASL